MRLNPQETELVGKWIVQQGQVRGDATCERIHSLTSNHLRRVAVSKQWGAWETLFQDPDDGRYWEQTYPEGDLHGGGPPTLKHLSKDQAKTKYGDEVL
jgi:Immunity protein 27